MRQRVCASACVPVSGVVLPLPLLRGAEAGDARRGLSRSQETSDESDGADSPSPRQSRVSGGGHGRGRGAVPESQGTSDESDEADARADLDAETLLAIRRSLEESCGTDRQRKRSARQESLGVDSNEFSNMSESDLRYHTSKYAELKLEWQDKHPGRVIPNGISVVTRCTSKRKPGLTVWCSARSTKPTSDLWLEIWLQDSVLPGVLLHDPSAPSNG